MAALKDINICVELRPCIIRGEHKALFHRWVSYANVIGASPMIGGHPGGQIEKPYAIVEFEDGTVAECDPTDIRFCDPPHKGYYFETERKTNGNRE